MTQAIKTPSTEKNFAGLSFLLVDDDSDLLFMLERMVRSRGCRQVWCETNARSALASVQNRQTAPDIIISDCRMPQASGLKLLQAIRSGVNKHIPRDTPFVLMTGYSEAGTVSAAKQLDVNALVAKPASVQTFISAVQRALKGAAPIKEADHYKALPIS